MSTILIFIAEWRKWERVLRIRKDFGLFDSVRFGLWLARGFSGARAKVGTRKKVYRTACTV